MKKFLILASILLVLTLVFVACTDKNPGEDTTGENVTVENPETDTPTETPTEEPTEESTEEPVVTDTPTEVPTEEPVVTDTPTEVSTETPTEPPVEDLDAPVYTVGGAVLADYASQTGDLWYTLDLEVPEVMSEGSRTFARMIPNGSDPYFVITESKADRQIARYMAISYRTNIAAPGTMFLGYGAAWTGQNDFVYVDWNEDENWNLVIIDLSETGITSYADDLINYGRFSIYEHYSGYEAKPEDYFDIEYVAFFGSDTAAEKYDAEMHRVPMWNEDQAIVAHQSFDQLYTGAGDAGNGPENVFEPGKSADWDFVADLSASTVDTLTYWGWIGYYGDLGQFGYQINGGAPVYNANFAFVGADHEAIIAAAQNSGADSGHRMKIAISLAGLGGENTVRVLYKDAAGHEVCLNEFTVKLAAHEHSHETVVTAPTCTEAGYTTYTCACGDSYVADEVAALGHTFVDGACSVCGGIDPDFVKPDPEFADLPTISDEPAQNYVNGYTVPETLDLYNAAEAAEAGVPEGYSGNVLKLYGTSNGVGVVLDFTSWGIKVEDIVSMTIRYHVDSSCRSIRMANNGALIVNDGNIAKDQWAELTLTGIFDKFNNNEDGTLGKVALCFRYGTTFYVDSIVFTLTEKEDPDPVEPKPEITELPIISEEPAQNYVNGYTVPETLDLYSAAEAAEAGVPEGYSGNVLKLYGTSNGVGVVLDFTSWGIKVEDVVSMTIRYHVDSSCGSIRMANNGAFIVNDGSIAKDQWAELTLTGIFDKFNNNEDGTLGKVALCFRYGTTFYVDSIVFTLSEA